MDSTVHAPSRMHSSTATHRQHSNSNCWPAAPCRQAGPIPSPMARPAGTGAAAVDARLKRRLRSRSGRSVLAADPEMLAALVNVRTRVRRRQAEIRAAPSPEQMLGSAESSPWVEGGWPLANHPPPSSSQGFRSRSSLVRGVAIFDEAMTSRLSTGVLGIYNEQGVRFPCLRACQQQG